MFSTSSSLNFYQLLEINENASLEEIKQAYHKKARETHKDKHPTQSDQLFMDVKNAYEVLSDPHKRSAYDKKIGFVSYQLLDLSELVREHNLEAIKKIIAAQKKELGEMWRWDYDKNHFVGIAISEAIQFGHTDIVDYFLKEGVDADRWVPDSKNKNSSTHLLHIAIQSGQLNMVKLLVDNGAKFYPNKNDRDDWNNDYGLRTAVKEGHADIVEYLLERGAPANGLCGGGTLGELYGGTTFLARAAQDGNRRIVEALLAHGAKIETSISNAYEKMIKHGYNPYQESIERKYSDNERIAKLEYGIGIPYYNHDLFYYNYKLTPSAKKFFDELNRLLINPSSIKNNLDEKYKIANFIAEEIRKFNLRMDDKEEILAHINNLIETVEQFDKKKKELLDERDKIKNDYERIVRTLMDYAAGTHFKKREAITFYGESGGLLFLRGMNVAGINFVGMSLDGKHVTHDLLIEEKLEGADKAIVTLSDLNKLANEERKQTIQKSLDKLYEKNGFLLEDGIVNLVPLDIAAGKGEILSVAVRLDAGIDPNERGDEDYPLLAAAKGGHLDIVKMIIEAHEKQTNEKSAMLFRQAEKIINSRVDARSLYFKKGNIVPLHSELLSQDYLAIALENDFTTFQYFIKRVNKAYFDSTMNWLVQNAKNSDSTVIVVMTRQAKMEEFYFPYAMEDADYNTKIDELLDKLKSWDYLPVLFTDKNNLKLVKTVIDSQYQKVDQAKKLIVEAINIARKEKHAHICDYLESLLDVNEKDKNGETLLHKAVHLKDVHRVNDLIARGADVNIQNDDHETPLMIATANSTNWKEIVPESLKIMEILLDHGALVTHEVLKKAIEANSLDSLNLLLPLAPRENINVFHYSFDDKKCISQPWYVDLMFNALSQKNNIELLTLLKSAGADFNFKSDKGETLLNEAARLLPSFHDILSTMQDLKQTVEGCGERGQAMLKGSFVHLLEADRERCEKELKLLNYLLDNGADPACQNAEGYSPLYVLINEKDLTFLANQGYEILLEKLIGKGANLDAKTANGVSVLHAAVSCGDVAAVNFLINHHVKVNITNANGDTPLHLAAYKCFADIAELLLQAGADSSKLDKEGKNALTILEISYQTKRLDWINRYEKAKKEKSKESHGFFSRRESWEEQCQFHDFFKSNIQKLDQTYQQTKHALSVAAQFKSDVDVVEIGEESHEQSLIMRR